MPFPVPTDGKQTMPKKKEPVKKEPVKPTIPEDRIKEFLDGKLKLAGTVRVKNVEAGFLWSQGGVEKYRINVWCEKRDDPDSFCKQFFIGASYFVCYDRKDGTITDRTL
jgi:hypothetical protein